MPKRRGLRDRLVPLVALLITLAWLVIDPGLVEARSCTWYGDSLAENFEAADIVFVGRVIGESKDGEWRRFRISQGYKGVEGRELWVHTSTA